MKLLIVLISLVYVFGFIPTGYRRMERRTVIYQGTMPPEGGGDPLDAIKQKMAADPNYNPMQDPQAMQVLEGMVPLEMREVSGAIQRLKVAFTDATTGNDAFTLQELNNAAAKYDTKQELISSPNSDFIRSGLSEDVDVSDSRIQELIDQLKAENPEVPEK